MSLSDFTNFFELNRSNSIQMSLNLKTLVTKAHHKYIGSNN